MRLPPPYDRLWLPVYVPSLLMAISQMALLILLPLYALELEFGPVVAATLVGLRGVGVFLFDVPAGMLVARFGDKPVLLGGLGLILIGNVMLAMSANLWLLAISAMILGAGFAAWMLGRQSYIADVCERNQVGRAIAVMAGLQRAGTFIGPALGGVLAGIVGYQFTFVVGASTAVIAGVLVFAFAHNAEHQYDAVDSSLAAMLNLIRKQRRIFATAGLAALALQFMRSARQLLVPLFGQTVGLDVAQIGAIYSLSAALDMSLFYPVGILVDRRGRKWSAVPSMILFAAGLALLPSVSGFYSLLAVSLLLGLGNGMGTGIVMIIGADIAQEIRQRGQFLGLWRLIGDLGMSAAPLLSGILVGVASLAAASTAAASIGLAGTLVMVLLVPETLHSRSSARSTM